MCIEGLDRLRPDVRWQVLDGLRLMVSGGADLALLVAIGGQAVAMAARHAEGDLPGASIDQVLTDLFDLSITVPSLDVRRIGSMLQRHLAGDEQVLRKSCPGNLQRINHDGSRAGRGHEKENRRGTRRKGNKIVCV